MATPEDLNSDDLLALDPTLGRCWACLNLALHDDLTEMAFDVGEYHALCPACMDRETFR